MTTAVELLDASRASIVAPAGCGKTELIVTSVAASPEADRHLILTHTNAGVSALRSRFRRMKVNPARVQVDTIAGFCLRYGAAYPHVSGLMDLLNPSGGQWDAVYPAACRLLSTDLGREILAASYCGVFVDEYQDCSPEQHQVIITLAETLPVRVLGDPLQSIFGFRGDPVTWTEVERVFPGLTPLATPWRWHKTNPDLGHWLLDIRPTLLAGQSIPVNAADPIVRLNGADGGFEHLRSLIPTRQSVVAIRKWEAETHELAGQLAGDYTAIETVDCKDLAALARVLDSADRRAAIVALLDLFRRSTTGMTERITEVIAALGDGRRAALDDWQALYAPLKRFYSSGDPTAIAEAVDAFTEHESVRRFRFELLEEVVHAAGAVAAAECASFGEAAWIVRDQTRKTGRRPDRRIVSRTLLVKGLEFDHAVVPVPSELTAGDLYVALSRGSRSAAVVVDEQGEITYDGAS